MVGDVTNEADAVNIVESTIKHYGKLDILVTAHCDVLVSFCFCSFLVFVRCGYESVH